jgi:hypothetical protein
VIQFHTTQTIFYRDRAGKSGYEKELRRDGEKKKFNLAESGKKTLSGNLAGGVFSVPAADCLDGGEKQCLCRGSAFDQSADSLCATGKEAASPSAECAFWQDCLGEQ